MTRQAFGALLLGGIILAEAYCAWSLHVRLSCYERDSAYVPIRYRPRCTPRSPEIQGTAP